MGILDWLSWRADCPECGDPRARRTLLGGVRCPNAACRFFDERLQAQLEEAAATYRNPRTGERIPRPPARTDFAPGPFAIQVRYTNFRGEERTFTGDKRSLRRKGNHLSLRVAPSGRRIALSRERIGNLAEIDELAAQVPSPREQWILAFHRKRGSTSPLCDQLRAQYPEWEASSPS